MINIKDRLAVAFTGPSNSGKTTLIVKLTNLLQESGLKVAIIKNDPRDKAIFDKEGKDSFKFSQTGAQVAVVSPKRTTIFKKETSSIDEIISNLNEFDFLLVEGLKTLPLPRICVVREKIDSDYFEKSDTLAIDDSVVKSTIPNGMNILDLNNIEQIVQWIKENGKKV